jgi:predicted enzyme related to lactoylglutathione lyase
MVATIELVLDVGELDWMVEFYLAALGYERRGAIGQYASIVPPDATSGVKLIFQRVAEPKVVKNRLHLDIHHADIEAEATRLESLGARRVERCDEFGTSWIVMTDPEGNELCVCQS